MRAFSPCLAILLAATLSMLLLASAASAHTGKNLLNNGAFDRGSGDSVDGWRTDAWILTPGTTDYHWVPPEDGQPGELEILTHRDNDARWVQQVSLAPGWYYISVEARTRKILPFFTGANISVLEDGIVSEDLKGDNGWKRIGLYLKVGSKGADVDVALRLGGYMNLTRGQAFFRNASVIKVDRPPIDATHVFNLDEIRKESATGPIGHRWTLYAVYAFLVAVAAAGWRLMGVPPPKAIARRQTEPPPRTRKQA